MGQATQLLTEIWRRLTESYIVDLDAAASLLPSVEPEPIWLTARG